MLVEQVGGIACHTGRQHCFFHKLKNGTWEITGSLIVRNYVRTNPKADLRLATLTVKWTGIATEAAGV